MKIEPGEIRVAGADMMLDRPRMKVWHLDLDSKYAEILSYSTSEVLLAAGDRTLRTDEEFKGQPTAVIIDLPDDWHVIAECARYTCRIVAYQYDKRMKQITLT
jgi:hypothetical protein